MAGTKTAHLDLLTRIEERRRDGRAPTLAESLRLQTLLDAHDTAVAEFSAALAELRSGDPDALPALMAVIGDTPE